MKRPGVLLQMPCLEQTPRVIPGERLRKDELVGSDKRYLYEELQRFVQCNSDAFAFLGLTVVTSGQYAHTAALAVTSGEYIGAVPVTSSHTGKPVADVEITPRFGHTNEQIEEFLVLLGESVQPEYHGARELVSGGNVRPPLYLLAADYIQLYERVLRAGWTRFDTMDVIQTVPSGNVRWSEYAVRSHDPQALLSYPCHRNTLTPTHPEAQGLRWVFDLAAGEVTAPQVPVRLRQRLQAKIATVSARAGGIAPREMPVFRARLSDPLCVRQAKEQANLLLGQTRRAPIGWRLDMSKLWELFVQHVVGLAVRDLGGSSLSNPKLRALGSVPAWGLRYLEPDMVLHLPGLQVVLDAKYKSHMYNTGASTADLSDAHRADLHQVLAYCAFAGRGHRAAILVYPAATQEVRLVPYRTADGGATIPVMMLALPFSVTEVRASREWLRSRLLSLTPSAEV